VDNGSSSETSHVTSRLESVSSRDDGFDFQRGFLLNKSRKAKGSGRRVQEPKPTNTLLSKSSIATSATAKTMGCKKTSASPPKDPHIARETGKKDSGWAKGFLTNNKKINGTAKGTKAKEVNNSGKSKAHAPVTVRSKDKNLGWSRGFLEDKNSKRKEKEIKGVTKRNLLFDNSDSTDERRPILQTEDHPKVIRSSDSLLSIDEDDGRFNRHSAQTFAPLNTISNNTSLAGSTTSLISVISEGRDIENVASSTSLVQLQQASTLSCNEGASKGNVKGSTTLTTKSLITPLISIVKEQDCAEEKPSTVFIKEDSTTRNRSYESERADRLGSRDEQLSSHPDNRTCLSTENFEDESTYQKSRMVVSSVVATDPSNKKDIKREDSDITTKMCGNDNNILRLQQELERFFTKNSESGDNDDLQTLFMRFRTLEQRRYAWIYLLQQEQLRHKHRIKGGREKNHWDDRIRQLFDTEYFYRFQQQHETIVHPNKCDDVDIESPFESILRCVETENDRGIVFQIVVIIKDFTIRYREKGLCQHRKPILLSSRKDTEARSQAETIRRLMLLFARLTQLSTSGVRRTKLVQSAWEAAVLLFSFCIRESSRMPSLSSLLPSLLESSGEQVDSLLGQQLIWQQSKATPNAVRINQLQETRTQARSVLREWKLQQEGSIRSLTVLQKLMLDLENLVKS